MTARIVLSAFLLLLLARPAHAQWEEEDLWNPAPKPTPRQTRVQPKKSDGGKIGVGVAIGAPTGLTGKLRLDGARAVDAALAYDQGVLYVHSDYLFAGKKLVDGKSADVGWFVGIGGRAVLAEEGSSPTLMSGAAKKNGNGNGGGGAGFGSSSATSNLGVGARIPAGLSLKLDAAKRLELFGEIALDVAILNGDGTSVLGAIGGRWFF